MTQLHTKANLLNLVSLNNLLNRFQTTRPLLDGHLEALKIQTQEFEGETYITLPQLHKLDEYYQRLQLGWVLSLLQGQDHELRGI